MPSETWGNILQRVEDVLRELAINRHADLTADELETLALHVQQIRMLEHQRTVARGEPPMKVIWDDEDYFDDPLAGDEGALP